MTSVDPVCAMRVSEPDAPEATFNGVLYRFCCEMCREAFLTHPAHYLKGPAGGRTFGSAGSSVKGPGTATGD